MSASVLNYTKINHYTITHSSSVLELGQIQLPKIIQKQFKPQKDQNMYGAVTQKTWNNCQQIKDQDQHLLDMENSDIVQKHTAT